jgi:hypothetical protein
MNFIEIMILILSIKIDQEDGMKLEIIGRDHLKVPCINGHSDYQ